MIEYLEEQYGLSGDIQDSDYLFDLLLDQKYKINEIIDKVNELLSGFNT